MAPIQVSASSSARSGSAYGGGGLNESIWVTGSTGSGPSGVQMVGLVAVGLALAWAASKWKKR